MKHRFSAAFLAALLALSLAACGGGTDETPGQEPEAPAGVAVQVETVGADTIYTENTVSGQIAAEEQTTVMAAVNAKCVEVYFEAGDEIRAGQAICRVDLDSTLTSYGAVDTSYQAAIQSYNDQREVFEKQIALLEKSVADLKALFEIGAASQLEIDQAELQLQTALATRNSTLSQLEAGMQNYKSNLEQL
ncbi:MAG: TolC family protein, partial [Dysosmobacter sp.]|nr:TolC family protein [Dysosmobacter sp.]